MKIRFRKVTNIRSDHRSLNSAPLGVVYANTLLEVDGALHEGASVNGDNRWWRDHNGWYYWAGETEAVAPEATEQARPVATLLPPPVPPPATPAPLPTPPVRPPVAAAELAVLPTPPDDGFANNAAIPDGEWRALGETIMEESNNPEEGNAGSELESFQTPMSTTVSPSTATASTPPELLTPRAQRLNWGLEAGQIHSRWWQENGLSGRGVNLAILSTGADAGHPDLVNNPAHIFENQATGDTHGLGTQAAIVAAGKGQIAYGVAPEVKLLIGKIGATPNDITLENLITGLEWAIAQKADVAALLVDFIELSGAQKQVLEQAIARALDANMVLLAPVGNSSERKPEDRYPSALEGVISVGAHHSFNRRADFSAKSYHLDFLAPGEDLKTSNLQQGFGSNLKNTAIATAFAAGFVALIRQWEKRRGTDYSPADIVALLRETAHYEGINKGKDTEMGHGILNPNAVIERLLT